MTTPLKPLKWYKSLGTPRGRRETGVFPVEGIRAIRQIAAARPEAVTEILATGEVPPLGRAYPVRPLTESQYAAVSSTRTPQGIMAVVRVPANTYAASLPSPAGDRVLLLEDIQDPGNAGTLIRTAAAFDFTGVIMTEKSADPLAPKCVQATAGAVLSVWIRRTAGYLELAAELRRQGYTLVAADLDGRDAPAVLKKPEKLLLALGNEAAGLSPELLSLADARVRLPTAREKAESLNVAACGAICMYLSRYG